MITIVTLMAGRLYSFLAFFWGLEIIDFPKNRIHLLFMTNSQDETFKHFLREKVEMIRKDYASVRIVELKDIPPTSNSFIERGEHSQEHAEMIGDLYNQAYKLIDTDWFLFLEDDVVAPSNAIKGLMKCYEEDKVGYACGTQMNRHGPGLFIWNLRIKSVFPDEDACREKQYYACELRNPYGVRDIGLGHFGITLLRKTVCDKLPQPVFKWRSDLSIAGALVGCDMVLCLELDYILKMRRLCNFDVRALHMDSKGIVH